MQYSPTSGGFYDAAIHVAIPDDAVAITEDTYRQLLDAQASGMAIIAGADGRPVAAWPVLDPTEAKSQARVRVDARAERARLQFITPGAGQALVYQRKEAQACACLASHDALNPPPAGAYPALEAEVGINGADVLAVAQVVVGLADAWGANADQIEAQRLSAKAAIAAVPDDAPDLEAQIAAIEASIVWPAP